LGRGCSSESGIRLRYQLRRDTSAFAKAMADMATLVPLKDNISQIARLFKGLLGRLLDELPLTAWFRVLDSAG